MVDIYIAFWGNFHADFYNSKWMELKIIILDDINQIPRAKTLHVLCHGWVLALNL